jgi:hypothetical protein
MRVAITNLVHQAQTQLSSPQRLDLPDSEAISGDAALRLVPALRGFLSSVNEEDSPVSVVDYKIWNRQADSEAEPHNFALRLELAIFPGDQSFTLTRYEDFASRLANLLEREPGEAVRAELQIVQARRGAANQMPCLILFLFAGAAIREQALMRCSFGLARVQQALLFEARAIRQGRI